MPFPINTMTLKLVEYLLSDKSVIQNRVDLAISERERLIARIKKIGSSAESVGRNELNY
jgi:histidinol-phosphate/aromatic aminotransferase/cobyric acid decarboxylase-like protein